MTKKLLAAAAVLALFASPALIAPAHAAKSTNAATGIGKNGTPPGKAKAPGESAKSKAPGQTK
jgi:hypothetical protein